MAKREPFDHRPYMRELWSLVAAKLIYKECTNKTGPKKIAESLKDRTCNSRYILINHSRKRAYILKKLEAAGYVETKKEYGQKRVTINRFMESHELAEEPKNWLEIYRKQTLSDIEETPPEVDNIGYVSAGEEEHALHYFWHPELYSKYEGDDPYKKAKTFVRPKCYTPDVSVEIPRNICLKIFKKDFNKYFHDVTGEYLPAKLESTRQTSVNLEECLVSSIDTDTTTDVSVGNTTREIAYYVNAYAEYFELLKASYEKMQATIEKHGGPETLNNKIMRRVIETLVVDAPLHLTDEGWGDDSYKEWGEGHAQYILEHPDQFRYERLFPTGISSHDESASPEGIDVDDLKRNTRILKNLPPPLDEEE